MNNTLPHTAAKSAPGFRRISHAWARRAVGLVLLVTMSAAFAQSDDDFYEESKPWEELAVHLPAPPQSGNLLSFYVSPTATLKFSVDAKSVSVGSDGVVRYTLVAVSPQGARNVSYEGIRCATFEHKIYATGNDDGTWAPLQQPQWMPIRRGNANRERAALAQGYFCENLTVAGKADDIVRRLKSGHTLTDDLLSE